MNPTSEEKKHLFRVRLIRCAFYEVETYARSAEEAAIQIEQHPPEKPTLVFHTTPVAHTVEAWHPWDGGKWVKVQP